MSTIEVKVPDIGDFKDIPVIEIFVKAGDSVKAEDSLISLESDKATMDVPAPAAGVVKDVRLKLGDKVSEGSLILTLDTAAAGEGKAAAPRICAPTAGRRSAGGACCRVSTSRSAACSGSLARPGVHAGDARRRHRQRSIQGRARVAVRAQVRARAGCRPGEGQGHRAQRAHPAGRRSELRQAGA